MVEDWITKSIGWQRVPDMTEALTNAFRNIYSLHTHVRGLLFVIILYALFLPAS